MPLIGGCSRIIIFSAKIHLICVHPRLTYLASLREPNAGGTPALQIHNLQFEIGNISLCVCYENSPGGAKDCSPRREPRVSDVEKGPAPERRKSVNSYQAETLLRPSGAKTIHHRFPRLTPWAKSFRSSGASEAITRVISFSLFLFDALGVVINFVVGLLRDLNAGFAKSVQERLDEAGGVQPRFDVLSCTDPKLRIDRKEFIYGNCRIRFATQLSAH